MSRIAPLDVFALTPSAQRDLAYARELMGFTPNDVLTMARWPAFLDAVKQVVAVVYAPSALDATLKRLIATVVSGAAGCRYCQAHTAHGAVKLAGADAAKVAAVWEYKTSALFSDAERAALNFALAAGQQPNAVTDDHFAALRLHFSEQVIIEMLGVISLFGLLNRWNDTVGTELEDAPRNFARAEIDPKHWQIGKHARDE
jgi:uncharacterized peroxidase-related enzyme